VFSETDAMIKGSYPSSGGPFPLFMWMPSTGSLPSGNLPQILATQMANRGYAAVAVQYADYGHIDNRMDAKAAAVSGSSPHSALSVLCALDYVDCSKGVAAAGYSQGTHIAPLLAKHSNKITAAYMIEGARPTVSGIYDICDNVNLHQYLPASKRRYMTGEGDEYYGWTAGTTDYTPTKAKTIANLKLASGYDCGDSVMCYAADGSGYFVPTTNVTDGHGTPDHFNWAGESKVQTTVAEWFNTAPVWGFQASLDWLASAARV